MKKRAILYLFACCCLFTAGAQSPSWQALNYQAVALDETGQAIKNRNLDLRISLSGGETSTYFVEKHQASTDANGAFSINIGRGKLLQGNWQEIPWATTSIWLKVEMSPDEKQAFTLVSDRQLLAVPFAFHANSTNRLVEPLASELEKTQSIRWLTSGNTGTNPPTHFLGTTDNKNLVFRTNNIPQMTLTTEGKLELLSQVPAGSDKDKANYPMVVEGNYNTQGMWIQINGSRSTANNFMTFVDDSGIQGRIEGQTISELEGSEIYATQAALYALNTIVITAEIAALSIEAPVKLASGWSTPAGVAIGFKIANLTVKLASMITAYNTWLYNIRSKVGVTFSSGNGDYAEWLMRKAGERDLHFGEVVGVKDGQISLNTKGADHLMVVSKAPIVLGNAPQPDQQHLYERVAFMGQVPVKIAGPVSINDYILPSGNEDGFAIAVHPQDMKTLDYGRILGVAWEAAADQPINIVTVAVGINTNDLAPRVEALTSKVEQIEAYLAGKAALPAMTGSNRTTAAAKHLSNAEFDRYVDDHAGEILGVYQQVKRQLQEQNIDVSANPYLLNLLNNPLEETKKLRRNPAYATQWGMIDQKLQLKK